MRRSPWLPILLLVAVGLYFAPRESGRPFEFNFDFSPIPRLQSPADLPAEAQDLFRKTRPASVRVEQSQDVYGAPDAIGTGFFIDSKGTLLTAYHVIEGAKFLNVTTVSRQRFRAEVVGFDAARDVAVLKANVRGTVPYLQLAERSPRIGERVLAVGNSRGQFLQPRRGRLLRLGAEAARADFPQGTLEMNAPLAPGDSGGPIVDSAGRAIGVVSYIRLADGAFGLNQNPDDVETLASYAVPVTSVDETVRALRRGEKRDVPALGVSESQHASFLGGRGAVIGRVYAGTPAAEAGLRSERAVPEGSGDNTDRRLVADVVVAVDGQPTGNFNDLLFQIRQKRVGETVALTVLRDGKRVKVDVKLAPRASINYDQP
ncbi:S1C family serine protease [Deinococcus pimensis]|uniref:S1C family serine protease n=1 Tax=Deinococcus pimensis TaxID=309888 RepID=UPI0004AFA70D|nr:S1C family serine protease [Deinococcus pimensis]